MSLLQTLSADLADVTAGIYPSLVQLTNGRRSSGAGTIWHEDGLILTNAHVVQRHAPQVTLLDGRTFASRLLAVDEKRDLAALSIPAGQLPTIELGHSRKIKPGQWVTAVGHPWGVIGAASSGAVIDSGKPPELPRYPGDLIQVGLQLRPGHSGGPLVDEHGRLIGINTMIAGPQVGLAIPIHAVKQFLREHLGKATQPI